jgi:dTMP kinase
MTSEGGSSTSMKGKLIVLEGIDGAGTTTQAQRLGRHFGARLHVTREPSDGAAGMLIRQILRGEHRRFDHTALALLFAADRLDHLRREIEPQLDKGVHVVSDRYVISSFVYQSLFVDGEFVHHVNRYARPADLTLLLAVPVQVALDRRQTRGMPDELFDPIEHQRRVAAEYAREAERLRVRENVKVLDGTRPPDEVFAVVRAEVEAIIGA